MVLMVRSWVLAWMLTSSMAQAQVHAQAQNTSACQPVQSRKGGGAVLGEPGRYCIARDMLVDSHYRPFAHGSS